MIANKLKDQQLATPSKEVFLSSSNVQLSHSAIYEPLLREKQDVIEKLLDPQRTKREYCSVDKSEDVSEYTANTRLKKKPERSISSNNMRSFDVVSSASS